MPSPEKQLSGNSRAVGIPSTALPGPSWSHGLPTVAAGDAPGGQNHRSPRGPSLGAGAGTVSSPIPRANPELRKGMRGIPWQRDERNVKVSFNININPSEGLQERTVPPEGCPGMGRWAQWGLRAPVPRQCWGTNPGHWPDPPWAGRARAGASAAAGPAGPGDGDAGGWPSPEAWPGWSRQPASHGHWPGVPGHCTAPAGSPGTGSCGTPGAAIPRWRPPPRDSLTAPRWHRHGSHPRTWGDGQESGAAQVAGHPTVPAAPTGMGTLTCKWCQAPAPPRCPPPSAAGRSGPCCPPG